MYRNRLTELAAFTKEPDSIGNKLRENMLSDQITDTSEDQKYSSAKMLVRQIKETNLQLEKSKREYFKTTKPERQKQIYKRINDKISSNNGTMQSLKPLLQEINTEFKQESQSGDKSKLVEFNRVTQEANEVITEFREIQQNLTAQMKNTIHRQANIIQGQKISQNQLQHLVHHPERGQQMLRQKLLDSPSVQLQNSVSDIIDKCNDVLKLQKSMRECMTMMQQLAMLVQFQGQKLTTIEMAIEGAKNHIDKGDGRLESGKELHKKSQKKMCCIMMVLLAIIGVIVIPIVITQIK